MDEILDIQILIKTPTCLLSKHRDLKVNIIDIRGAKRSISHLVEVDRDQCNNLLNMARESDLRLTSSVYREGSCIARISSKGCLVCKTIISKGAFLISGNLLADNVMSYSFIIARKSLLHEILETFDKEGVVYEILSVKRVMKKRYLTPRQEQVLILSLKSGLFDYPRRIKLSELANMLGIKPSTFAEILRRGIKKVLENTLYQ